MYEGLYEESMPRELKTLLDEIDQQLTDLGFVCLGHDIGGTSWIKNPHLFVVNPEGFWGYYDESDGESREEENDIDYYLLKNFIKMTIG
jgi:hypothetical protein